MAEKAGKRRSLADTIELLWAPPMREVGRTGLTVGHFINAAIELVVSEGVEALSMRNLAERLNVRAMAIYSAIPSKQDLIALMVDQAHADAYPDCVGPRVGDWREGLIEAAVANRGVHRKHPWLLDIASARSLMGPHEARKTELELRVLEGIGLSDIEMERALSLVLTHVAQHARLTAQLGRERRDTGLDDEQWWGEAFPALHRVYEPQDFPLLVRVASAVGAKKQMPNLQSDFDFGLQRILDGIQALLDQRRG